MVVKVEKVVVMKEHAVEVVVQQKVIEVEVVVLQKVKVVLKKEALQVIVEFVLIDLNSWKNLGLP